MRAAATLGYDGILPGQEVPRLGCKKLAAGFGRRDVSCAVGADDVKRVNRRK